MQKYTDLVLGQNGQTLLPVSGASVSVLNYPAGTPATIYSDNGVTITGNPLTTDLNGRYSFYAANGRYSLQITFGSLSYALQDFPLEDDPANGQSTIITGGSIDNTPIGATTPSTGVFTSLTSASGALNGSVGATTPNTGAFTSLSSASGALNGTLGATTPSSAAVTTLAATGAITPSQTAGVVGTTTNNNANAGSIGEYISSTFSAVSLTTSTLTNVASISLTAGDWDVSGGCQFTSSVSGLITNCIAGASSTSATLGAAGTSFQIAQPLAATNVSGAIPVQRFSLAATTTVFCVGFATFASGTATASGVFRARRVR